MSIPPELDFGPRLEDAKARLETLLFFNSVQPYSSNVAAIENGVALPPAAYVSFPAEAAEPNKLIGGHGQRVTIDLSVLYCVRAENIAGEADDALETTRRAVIRLMIGWTLPQSEKPLDFVRHQIRASGDGLIWAEAVFRTTYRLDVL